MFLSLICVFILLILIKYCRSIIRFTDYIKTYDVVFRNENNSNADITLKAFEDLSKANILVYTLQPGLYHVFAPKDYTIIGSHSILLSDQCNCLLTFRNGDKRIYMRIRT